MNNEVNIHKVFVDMTNELLDLTNTIDEVTLKIKIRTIIYHHISQMTKIILPSKTNE